MLTALAKSQLTIEHRPSPVKTGSVWRKTTSSFINGMKQISMVESQRDREIAEAQFIKNVRNTISQTQNGRIEVRLRINVVTK